MSLKKFNKSVGLIIAISILVGAAQAVTPIDSCTSISTPGEYVLNQSIVNSTASYDCIIIASNDVIFDGAGYTIDGIDAGNTYGVHVWAPAPPFINITIKNLIVTDWKYGISYSGTNGKIENVTASSNNIFGGCGICLTQSNNNTLTNNIANSNYVGVKLSGSNNNALTSNNVIWNDYGIYLSQSSNNTLKNNKINLNSYIGVEITYSAFNNTFIDNEVSNNSEGIRLNQYSNNNTFTGNDIIWNNYGMVFEYYSGNNTVYNNNFYNIYNNVYSPDDVNYWNTTKTIGKNIIGGPYLGGNFWGKPDGTGFSQTCVDADRDGICDASFIFPNNVDYLPISLNFIIITPPTIGYSALVATGQNTYVQSSNGTFGLLLKGQTKTINNSVILNNTGDLAAKVEARFNDSIGGVFGLISGANVLNSTNFALGLPSALIPLNNSGADVQVAIAPPGVTALGARLSVPSDQFAGDYNGTVILTFSNSV